MKKTVLIIIMIFISGMNLFLCSNTERSTGNAEKTADERIMQYFELYDSVGLEGKLDKCIFLQALAGYDKIKEHKNDMLTIIDFSQPSSNERMFVIDMRKKKLLFSSVVSHGRNSGRIYATDFSNQNGSYKSSLGFYMTGNTYKGKNGYSLTLDGLEKGINDNAKKRAIVVHGAGYCNPDIVRNGGMLGRSLGCPAIPLNLTKKIIDTIKGGSVMFIYGNSRHYLSQSKFIEKSFLPENL